MFPLHSILAIQDTVSLLGPIGAAFCAVVLLIAFSGGFAKGFRRVRWGGLIWCTASLVFILLNTFTPVGALAQGFGAFGMLGCALGCALAVLALYGVLALFVRPRMRWIKDKINGDDSLAEYGLEFEPEYVDYDGENDYEPYGKILQKTGCQPPSVFGRLLGGLTCAVNAAMALFGVMSFVLIMIGTTKLAEGNFGAILTVPLLKSFFDVVINYALDILTLGLALCIAIKGYQKGFFESLRTLIVKVGGLAAVALCFYLPFSPYATATDGVFYLVAQLVERSSNAFGSLGALAPIIGKVFAGLILAIFAIVAFVLLNVFLTRCGGWIERIRLTRTVDGCLSVVLYAIIGAAVCIGIWFVFGALDCLDIVLFRQAIGEKATLSKALLAYTSSVMEGVLAPFLG